MANVGWATLSVIPSAAGFHSALSRDIDPGMDSLGRNSGRLLGMGLLAGAAVVVAGIGAIVKTGVGEAMDASAGTAQLAAGIKSTGNAANVSVKGMNALASSIEGYSGQTDDSIVQSEALLLTFTNIKNGVGAGSDIFDRATEATANMAARMGGDAAGSAIQLGKALNDPVAGMTGLSKAGVQFTDAQKDSIKAMVAAGDTMGAQKLILKELETQFGGAAEAAGGSLVGQLERAKRSFEGVSQSVVEGLLPIVLPGLTSIGTTITTKVIPAVSTFVQGFKDGEGPGGKFRDILIAINDKGIKPIATFLIAANVAVQGFIQGFRDATGPGGQFRDILVAVNDKAVKPLAAWITDHVVPALKSLETWITGPGGAALWSLFQSCMKLAVPILALAAAALALAGPLIDILAPALLWVANVLGTTLVPGIASFADQTLIAVGIIALGAKGIGDAFTSLWNTALQPVLKFIVGGFANVMTTFGSMLVALGQVPEFGWATDAGNKINDAAGKVRGFSDSIKAIPASKNVAVTISYAESWAAVSVATRGSLRVAGLAEGGTVLPTPGGTIVRVAEAGRSETVVDTETLNAAMAQRNGSAPTAPTAPNGPVTFNLYDVNGVLMGAMHGAAVGVTDAIARELSYGGY